MKLHLFLVVVSICSYAFLGWYVYRLGPRAPLNRAFAVFSLFVAAWTLLLFLFWGEGGTAVADEWYANQLFSYAPKSLLFFHYALHLTGRRERLPTALLAVLYALSGAVALAGILYYAGSPIGAAALAVLGDRPAGLSGWRAAYTALALAQYAAGFAAVALWWRSSPLKRIRHMAALTLATGVLVVALNAAIGLMRGAIEAGQIDELIVAQLVQPYLFAFGIAYYRGLRPVDSLLSADIRSQLTHSIAALDRDGRIVSANAAIEELSGMPAARLEGLHYGELLSEAAPGAVRRAPSLSSAEFFEADFKSQGGASIPMSVSVTPIKDRWGDCEGFVLIGQPIRRLADERNTFGLSSREREVCLLLMQGLANQEIAERLYISPGTVKNHLYNIYEKTGVRNRVELSRLLS